MATLVVLVKNDVLLKFSPDLDRGEFEDRFIFRFPRVATWMSKELLELESTWNLQITPAEQVDALLTDFCAGVSLAVGNDLKILRPAGNGIWELKTADIRLFGWFIRKDHFVISDVDDANKIKLHNLYHGYCNNALRLRSELNLDEPKFVEGDNVNDVVSNWYFP